MIKGYVYHRKLVSFDELNHLISQISQSPQNYYFLRYSYGVSGICAKPPEKIGEIEGQVFNSICEMRWKKIIEGQVFNSICEMRWKKIKSGYKVLVLSQQELHLEEFEQLPGNWKIIDRNACWYEEEPRFPKGFTFQNENGEAIKPDNIKIKQRYFQDSDTATTHFVALTIN
jgi:hypothetical protein